MQIVMKSKNDTLPYNNVMLTPLAEFKLGILQNSYFELDIRWQDITYESCNLSC